MPVTLKIGCDAYDEYLYIFIFTDEIPDGYKQRNEVRGEAAARDYLQQLNTALKSAGLACREQQEPGRTYTYEETIEAKAEKERRLKEEEDKREQDREDKKNQSEGTYVLSGNPRLGKSTTGNCILEEQKFESGPGAGRPVTEVYEEKVSSVNEKAVVDTPSLAAGKEGRKKAAREIEKPLRQGGVFRLLFFVKDEFGYVTEESKTSIRLILDAFRDIRDNEFSIIVNMCHGDWADQMNEPQNEEQQSYKEMWEECLLEGLPRTTRFIWYEKIRPEWLYKNNKYAKLGEDTETFLANAPKTVLPENEGKILDETYEDMVDELAKANQRFAELRETLAAGQFSPGR